MYYIGIDVGGTAIKAGLCAQDGTILKRATCPALATQSAEEIAAEIAALAASLCTEEYPVESIGIGIPGACDNKNGVVLHTANLPFRDFPLRDMVQKKLHLPVYLENDANCAALGEYFLLPEKVPHMLLVTLGTGVGGGIIIDGRLYTGADGTAGEFGHMLLCKDGEPCNCGRHGCYESYASVTALIRQTVLYAKAHPESAVRKAMGTDFANVSGETAFTLMKAGDAGGKEIVATWLSYVGAGLIDLINIFQPNLVLIGGAISREDEILLAPIRAQVLKESFSKGKCCPEIKVAALGNDAGICGAAFLGREK